MTPRAASWSAPNASSCSASPWRSTSSSSRCSALLLALSSFTAVQRFAKVWRQASQRDPRRRARTGGLAPWASRIALAGLA